MTNDMIKIVTSKDHEEWFSQVAKPSMVKLTLLGGADANPYVNIIFIFIFLTEMTI